MPSARRVIDSDRTRRSPIGWVVEGDAHIANSKIVAIAGVGHIVSVRLVASSTDAKDYGHNSLDTGGWANAIGCRRLTTSAEVERALLHSSGKAGLVAIGWDDADKMDVPVTIPWDNKESSYNSNQAITHAAILSMNILHELIENIVNRLVEKARSFVQDSVDWTSYWSK